MQDTRVPTPTATPNGPLRSIDTSGHVDSNTGFQAVHQRSDSASHLTVLKIGTATDKVILFFGDPADLRRLYDVIGKRLRDIDTEEAGRMDELATAQREIARLTAELAQRETPAPARTFLTADGHPDAHLAAAHRPLAGEM